jgi:hypothetical protein
MLRPADSTCLFCDPRGYATTTQLLAGVQTVSQGANPRGSSSLSGEKRDPSPDAVLTSAPDTWPPGAAPEALLGLPQRQCYTASDEFQISG